MLITFVLTWRFFCALVYPQWVRCVRLQDRPRGGGRGGEAGCEGESSGAEVPVHVWSGGVRRGEVGELPGQHHEQRPGAIARAQGPDPLRRPPRAPLPGVALVRLLPRQKVPGPTGARLLRDLTKRGPGQAQPGLEADRTGLAAHFAQQQALRLPKCRRHPETQERPDGLLLEESRHRLLPGTEQVWDNFWYPPYFLSPPSGLVTITFYCVLLPQACSYCPALSGPRGRLLEPHSHRGGLHAKRLLHQDSAWLTGKQAQRLCCLFFFFFFGGHGTIPGFCGVSSVIVTRLRPLLVSNQRKNAVQ